MPLYFAYGSNMDVAAMALRCPRSRALGPARLVRHVFFIMEGGYASVRREARGEVYGVLWDLALSDMGALDAYEDVRSGLYRKLMQPVLRGQGACARALVYVGGCVTPAAPLPGYMESVLAAARAWDFPDSYLRDLSAVLPPGARAGDTPHWRAPDGTLRRDRLMTFLSGGPLDRRAASPGALFAAGAALARLDLALADFRHPAEDQDLIWDLQQTSRLRELAPNLDGPGHRAIAEAALDRFERRVLPRLPHLRRQMIHNDLNPGNVLVEAAPTPRVSGLIDFGDALRGPVVQEAAVCAAYQLRPGFDPFVLSRHVVAGFQSVIPLEPEEFDLLPDLILARQVMGLLIFAWREGLKPTCAASYKKQVGRLTRRVERLLHPARPVPPFAPEPRP